MNKEEGYIKFQCDWEKQSFYFPKDEFEYINGWRQKLYDQNLIGAYNNGIGFGNLSIRIENTHCFIISGSATGNYKKLNKTHYAKVIDYSLKNNYVKCIGGTKGSSESLTHAAVYESAPTVHAVIHTHNKSMWERLISSEPTTSPDAEFGTPELAFEIKRLLSNKRHTERQLIVMGGHEEGIITFGKDMEEAGNVLINYQKQIANKK
jgi:ribulose-5-phosphate 4-epimerase/fuculose-1-phosphate aldolase